MKMNTLYALSHARFAKVSDSHIPPKGLRKRTPRAPRSQPFRAGKRPDSGRPAPPNSSPDVGRTRAGKRPDFGRHTPPRSPDACRRAPLTAPDISQTATPATRPGAFSIMAP